MFPTGRPALKLFSTDIAGKGTRPNGFFKLDLLLLWTTRLPFIVTDLRRRRRRGTVWCLAGLLYPEDLAVVKGEDGARSELEVWGEANGLVLVHHHVLVRDQVQQHALLRLLHSGESLLNTTNCGCSTRY